MSVWNLLRGTGSVGRATEPIVHDLPLAGTSFYPAYAGNDL